MEFRIDDHGFFWVAKARLPSWAGFLDRSGAYGGPGASECSDGTAEIIFAPEGRDISPLDKNEQALVQWFCDHEPSVSEAVKTVIFQTYPDWLESYGYSAAEEAEFMPALWSVDGLKRLIGLHSINLHQIDRDGIPYIGYEFGCTWDPEHGLGVLMYGTRMVEIGGSDTAGLLWIAEQDACSG
jgi:hypothetical protein